MKKELIHTRTITVNCFETEGERLIVEGSLTDERHYPYILHALNQRRDPGLMHRMTLAMELTIPHLRILSITAEMPVIPDAGCGDVSGAVQKLAGRRIQPGFTTQVRALLGKASGCVHLTNLILTMGSAAVQGLWSYFSRSREGGALSLPDMDGSMLLDSCHMWRKDGPFVRNVRQQRTATEKNNGR
ncbi:MAG: DUF2889 domain-containing protein [Syntrophales bacterium]